ncbi:MAG TPA: hypothetical protein VFC63_22075 [Blastocatellia bacterium]|nr:hypothetical protein [Blastocatellia bacterium]
MDPKLRSNPPSVPAEEKIGNTTQSLYLPVRVLFEDETGEVLQEIARTTYVSANKVIVPLRRRLQEGMVVRAAVPLPPSWRKHSFTDAVYITPAEVTIVQPEGELFLTNLNFLSDKEAARRRKEYEMKKAAAALSAKPTKKNRRGDSRLEIPLELSLALLDDFGNVIKSEMTITENISKGGARLMTSLEVNCGDIVHVKAIRETFETRAVVKNSYVNADHIRRINIQFMDAEWKI